MDNKFEALLSRDPLIVNIWSREWGFAGTLRFLSEKEAREFCHLVNGSTDEAENSHFVSGGI